MSTPTLGCVYNGSTNVLTVVLQNPPATGAPTTVTVALANATIPLTLADGQATLSLQVRPEITALSLRGTVSAAGVSTADFNVGDPAGLVAPFQVLQPAAQGDPYTVAPTLRSQLRAAYFGAQDPLAAIQDLYAMVSLLVRWVTDHAVPALTAASFTPVVLSADEASAYKSLQGAVAELPFGLATVDPSTGSPLDQWTELLGRLSTYQTATEGYAAAVAAIGDANLS